MKRVSRLEEKLSFTTQANAAGEHAGPSFYPELFIVFATVASRAGDVQE
jgi:hypothetical protein